MQPEQPAFRIPTVKAHRAYVYPGTPAWKPQPGHKLVALDLEWGNVDAGLDLDDVQLIDAATGDVLEAAPEVAFLDPHGAFLAWRKAPPSGIRRVLLVFDIPSTVAAVRVQLWDDVLTPVPITFAASGPAMPPERHTP